MSETKKYKEIWNKYAKDISQRMEKVNEIDQRRFKTPFYSQALEGALKDETTLASEIDIFIANRLSQLRWRLLHEIEILENRRTIELMQITTDKNKTENNNIEAL